jgi:hypothetical protein
MESKPHPKSKPESLREPDAEVASVDSEGPESLQPTGGPENAGVPPFDVRIVRDWDVDLFHQRVLQLESQGYTSRRETYRITPEMNPETGEVLHLHSIELVRPRKVES